MNFNDLWARGPRPRREGYLLIDHRASPGIPAETARKVGLDPELVAEGRMLESGTLTCSHCKCVVVPNPFRRRERAQCAKCDYHYICDICAFKASLPDYIHTPFERFMEPDYSDRAVYQAGNNPLLTK